jgi:uncharacterized protein (DUF4415 family)
MWNAMVTFARYHFAVLREKNGGYMQNSRRKSLTDWERVRREIAEDAPIPYDPEDGPYDPNDDAAVDAYWAQATIARPVQRGPQKSPTKKQVTLRLSPEVLAHFKAKGRGWQTRIDETLKKAIEPKRRKRAS